jgi:diguanylate cyclase (GGDEF)-like protein
MMIDPKLRDEFGRLAALQRYEVLDTPPDQPFDKITSLVQTILNVPMCTVSLVDKNRQWFKSCAGLDVRETTRDVSFCTHTIGARKPMIIEDASLDARFAASPLVTGKPFIRSYLGVPLETPDGYNIGALCALDTKPRIYDQKQVEVLKSFAAVVVDELELLTLVRTDQLTGAASRRAFTDDVKKASSRFARHGVESALIMFDLDHFKRINDTYGHPAGDAVLRAVGQCCVNLIRSADSFGRLGGEEFAILLPDTDEDGAMQTAERFRADLAGLVIPLEPPTGITASFGVATFSDSCRTGEALMVEADRALYLAKQAGRNRCCAARIEAEASVRP